MHDQYSHARDRGCTRPGCSVAGANYQVHHAVNDWADDGQTNVDDLTLACPQKTAGSNPAAGAPEKAKTAAPNGSHHHTSIQAKPG
jgi:hypothetical protein